MEHILRIAGRIEREGIAYFGAFIECCHKVFAHALHLVIIVVAGLVQQAQLKATGRAITRYRRRLEEVDVGLRDTLALLLQIGNNLLGCSLTVLPIFQINQAAARVGTRSFRKNFEAGQRRDALHAILLFGNLQQLLCHFVGAFDGCTGWRFNHSVDHALVFLRNEARRKPHVHPIGQ